MSSRPVGRRPGDPDVTRAEILEAARNRFAAVGFERATIRAIAAEAEVDPALVHHHFGTKQALFAAAHQIPVDPSEMLRSVASRPEAERGEAIARAYLTVFSDAAAAAVSLVRGAATNEAAARMLREFIEDVFLERAPDLTRLDRPRLRLALIGTHMIGIVFGRNIVGVRDLGATDFEELVTALAPTFQRYLTDESLFG